MTNSGNVIKNVWDYFVAHCSICEEQFSVASENKTNINHLAEHLVNSHQIQWEAKQYRCNECTYETRSKSMISYHRRSVHQNIKYNCDQCEKIFLLKTSLKNHIKSAHQGARYFCRECEKQFTQAGDLAAHVNSQHKGVKYNCEFCEKQFKDKKKLEDSYQIIA